MPLSGYTRMGSWQPKRLRYGASTKGQRVAGRFPESSCHGRRPWWNGMGNLEKIPPRMGAAQGAPRLKGYATVHRRRGNELRMGCRRGSGGARATEEGWCRRWDLNQIGRAHV